MRVLIIGGTYFLGRAFTLNLLEEKWKRTIKDEQIEIYLLNRGNMPAPEGINGFLKADRHDAGTLAGSEFYGQSFDIIVDFCAYEEKDIESLTEALDLSFDQYIFISTCDVYKHFEGELQDENAPFEDRMYPGEEGEYINGKVKLEAELIRVCAERKAHYTSIRPSYIYGPGNYAPREGIYFNWINKSGQILQPFDATGHFQLVYVDDLAKAIALVIRNEVAYDRAFNVCGTEMYTYSSFFKSLKKAVSKSFECVYMTVDEINRKRISLPFPLTEDESEQYSGNDIIKLGLDYISLTSGLRKSYDSFRE